ncbi:MAG: hypothetical protein ACRC0V_04455 [Fusobacteriaceae bacterium]
MLKEIFRIFKNIIFYKPCMVIISNDNQTKAIRLLMLRGTNPNYMLFQNLIKKMNPEIENFIILNIYVDSWVNIKPLVIE